MYFSSFDDHNCLVLIQLSGKTIYNEIKNEKNNDNDYEEKQQQQNETTTKRNNKTKKFV